MTLALLVPGVQMGGGTAAAGASTYVAPIGIKHGVIRSDQSTVNSPTGLSGQVV